MNMWLFLAILAVPIIEIALFIVIGGAIGLWLTLAWVVLSAFLGVIVLKGVASLGRISLSADMNEMRNVQSPVAHRLLVVIGGGLLVLPGFLTDAIGLALLIPPLRRMVIGLVAWRLRAFGDTEDMPTTIDGSWREVGPTDSEAKVPPQATRH
jgi:UPF0716 protein FxsA